LTNNKDGGADINVRIDLTGYDFQESHWKFNTEFLPYPGEPAPRWAFSKIKELSNKIHYDAESVLTKRPIYFPANKHCYSSELFFDRQNSYFDERNWANYGALSSPEDSLACLDSAGPGGKPIFVTRWFGSLDGGNKYDLVIQDI
jgi:hypothetical protein